MYNDEPMLIIPDPIMMLSELPFYNLRDEEFHKETEAWIYNSISSLIESSDLFKVPL